MFERFFLENFPAIGLRKNRLWNRWQHAKTSEKILLSTFAVTCGRKRAQDGGQPRFLLVQHRLGRRFEHAVQLGHAPDAHLAHLEAVHLQLQAHRGRQPTRVVRHRRRSGPARRRRLRTAVARVHL